MKTPKLLVKDLKDFIKEHEYMYASGNGKKIYIKFHAGPNIERYIVKAGGMTSGFKKVGDAVKFFNEL